MDPFHVVRLAGDALDQCRRRVQQVTCGHRGRKGDPLYAARRTLHTGAALLTEKQQARLEALISRSKVYELIASGRLRAIKIDGSRRVPVEAIDQFIARALGDAA